MKLNNTDLTARILLSVVGVILVGVIVYYTMNFMNSTTDAAGNVIEGTEALSDNYADYNITMYDGEEIRGSEVVNFCKKYLGDYDSTDTAPIYIQVETVAAGTSYSNKYTNNGYLADIKNFSSAQYYIKPTALFYCTVAKTTNKAITGVIFKQQ